MSQYRALLVTEEYPPQVGGVATYLHEVLGLHPDIELDVIVPGESKAHEGNVTTVAFASRYFPRPRWVGLFFYLLRNVDRKKYDALVAGQILRPGIVIAIVGFLYRIPVVIFAHGMDVALSQRGSVFRRMLTRWAYRRSVVVPVSEYTSRLVEQKIKKVKRMRVVYPAAPLPPPRDSVLEDAVVERHGLAAYRNVIFFVGRLVERKGVQDVLRSLPDIVQRQPDTVVCIAGVGPYRDTLERLAIELGVDRHVQFLGKVTDAEKWAWYRLASVFISLSHPANEDDIEGFGITYLEAAAVGLPVVARESGGVGDAVENGVSGFLLPDADPKRVARAVCDILENDELRKTFFNLTQKRLSERFTHGLMHARITSIFKSL